MKKLFVIILFIVLGMYFYTPDTKSSKLISTDSIEPLPQQTKINPRPDDFDASPEMQQDRKKFIQKIISEGHWVKTELTGSIPKLWVESSFLPLDEKTQNELLSVVYAYWMGELDNFGNKDIYWDVIVLKLDNGTMLGKRIAEYSPVYGIKIY